MFNTFARLIQKPTLALVWHQPTLRAIFEVQAALTYRKVRGVTVLRKTWGGVPGLEIRPQGVSGPPSFLYFHGGGFTIGSARTHRWLVARLAREAEVVAFVPNYRLAPEHPFPAAVEDALSVFDGLAVNGPVMVGGDSAGGCLALGLCLERNPLRALLLSPIVDLAPPDAETVRAFSRDILLPWAWVRRALTHYVGDTDVSDPRLSPIYGDLARAPQILVQAARGEALEPHARRLASIAPNVQLELTENVAHVWQLNAGWMKEANLALSQGAAFLAEGRRAPT